MARDLAYEAFTAAEKHLEELDRLEELETDTGEEQEWPDTAGPYCACDTCTLREALFAAWPVFLDGVAEVLRDGGHEDARDLVLKRLTAVPVTRAA